MPDTPSIYGTALATVRRQTGRVGSAVLALFGVGTIGLSTLPSDAPEFFLRVGLALTAAGTLGLIQPLLARDRSSWLSLPLRLASIAVNGLVVVWIGLMLLDGTVRGQLVIMAPLLVGVPATLNIITAAFGLERAHSKSGYPLCGDDLRGLQASRCPECGAAIAPPTTPARERT